MKALSLLSFLLLLLPSLIHCQETTEYGILNPQELEMQSCEFEKDAPAIILFDKGEATFADTDEGFVIRYERHTRIKILSEAGFEYSKIEIPLYQGKYDQDKVRDIEGFTYNMELGEVVKTPLDAKQVYKETINKYWYSKKFAMPQIKAGSIIEYKYIIESPFKLSLRDWNFQSQIPTLHSEFTVGITPFYAYTYRVQGTNTLTAFNSYEKRGLGRRYMGVDYNEMIYEFILKNVPSFQDESFISSQNDYIIKIDFQLAEYNSPRGYSEKILQTWPKLAKELNDEESFGKYIKKASRQGEKQFSHLTNLTEQERIDEILNHVKKDYKWNNRHGLFAYEDYKTFEKNKTGNTANMNLMAIGMLQGIGINAQPIISSTRNHGKVISSFPFLDQFNYVLILAEADGKMHLFDATDPFCSNSIIPSKCINGKGFIIDEKNEQWVNIANYTPSYTDTYFNYTIDPDEYNVVGDCRIKYSGFKAVQERKYFYGDEQAYNDYYKNRNLDLTDAITVENLHDNDKPFIASFSFKQAIDVIDDQIIINPFLTLSPKENQFKQEKRTLPIDMIYPKLSRFTSIINIPKGYKIDVLPEKGTVMNDNVEFMYVAQAIGTDRIQLVGTYNFKKPRYEAKDYKQLKNFMNTVTRKLNEKIILVKDGDIALQ